MLTYTLSGKRQPNGYGAMDNQEYSRHMDKPGKEWALLRSGYHMINLRQRQSNGGVGSEYLVLKNVMTHDGGEVLFRLVTFTGPGWYDRTVPVLDRLLKLYERGLENEIAELASRINKDGVPVIVIGDNGITRQPIRDLVRYENQNEVIMGWFQ